MLLSYQDDTLSVPHTSTCIVHTVGKICDGDVITITSPIFASTNFISKAINMSDRFDVPMRVSNSNGYITNTSETMKATLVCDDDDIFKMYVKELA